MRAVLLIGLEALLAQRALGTGFGAPFKPIRDSASAAKSIRMVVSTAMSMARRDPATLNDGQTLFQELLTFCLREMVHLRTILLNNPSPNRLLG